MSKSSSIYYDTVAIPYASHTVYVICGVYVYPWNAPMYANEYREHRAKEKRTKEEGA